MVLALALVALVPGVAAAAPAQARATGSRSPRSGSRCPAVPASRSRSRSTPPCTCRVGDGATPAPAVLVAHGFGGSKASVDADARELAARGFVVLTWSARGFGTSGGQIALDSPDYEVADAQRAGRLAGRPARRSAGRPRRPPGRRHRRVLRRRRCRCCWPGYDRRVDALAPVITWNDLGAGAVPERRQHAPRRRSTPRRAARSPRATACSRAAGPGSSSRRARPGEARRRDARPAPPRSRRASGHAAARFTAEVCAAYTEAATTGRLSPATADAAAPLLPRHRHRPDHRADAARAGRGGHAVRARPGRRQRPPDRRGRRAGVGDLVRRRPRRRPAGHRGARARSATGSTSTSRGAPEPSDAGHRRSATPCRAASGPRADTPTGRTVLAAAYPGLPGARGPLGHAAGCRCRASRRSCCTRPGGNPAAITVAARARRRAGQRVGGPGGRAHRRAARASRPSSAPRRSPRRRWSPARRGSHVTVARVPGQPAPAEAVLFAKTYEVAPDGARTLLGSAVAPMRVRGARPTAARHRSPSRCPAWSRRSRPATGCWCRSAPPTRATTAAPSPRCWLVGAGRRRRAHRARRCPGETVTASTVPVGPLIGIGVVLAAGAAGAGWSARLRRRAPATARAPDPDAGRRWRSATWPRPTAAGSARCRACRSPSSAGMVLGLLGPNGAGKTTVLRMLMGLIGRPPARSPRSASAVGPGAPVLARIGAFVEGPGFLPHLSGAENLRLYWAATGRPPARRTSAEALEIAGLGDSIDRRVGTYSQGMRQRLAIAQAMLGLPELLVLDEPTNGLDPPQIHAMREVLRRYAAGGRTVLVSSHLLAEVEQTCTPRRRHAPGHGGRRRHGRRDHRRRRRARRSPSTRRTGPPPCSAPWTACTPWRSTARRRARRAERHAARGRGRARWSRPGSTCARPARARRLEDAFLQLVGEDGRTVSERDRAADALDGARAGRRPRRRRRRRPRTDPSRTLPLRVELVRQLRRRRTQVAFALVVRCCR